MAATPDADTGSEVISCHERLHERAGCTGPLEESRAADDDQVLRERLAESGYLFFRGLLPRTAVEDAAAVLLARAAEEDLLDPGFPVSDGVLAEGAVIDVPDLADGPYDLSRNPALVELLGTLATGLMSRLLGEPARHQSRVLLRVRVRQEQSATWPHCDNVFMSRGTDKLLTNWIPLVPCPREVGGLMVLDGSHRIAAIRDHYARLDVDDYCVNDPDSARFVGGDRWGGEFSRSPADTQAELGGVWRTTSYRPGDLLVFTTRTIHASTDNRSGRIRLSVDTRYQPVSAPMDRRWSGDRHTIGHGSPALRGRIC